MRHQRQHASAVVEHLARNERELVSEKLELWMDGKLYASTSGLNVPTAVLHQVIQSGSASWTAPCPSCAVKINIDFVRIDRYVP